MKKNKISIFDLNSHIHRVYHAAIKNNKHEESSSYYNNMPNYIIKGVLNLVSKELSMYDKGESKYIAFVIDHDGKNFRHELYSDYKKNRDPTPKDLVFMRKCIVKLLEMSGYSVLCYPNVEADDVISTISKKASEIGFLVDVYTRDKDLLALVNATTRIINGCKDEIYTEDDVIRLKGVKPEKITDLLTLEGDKADNIKGVDNCGVKTASTILNSFSLNEILENPQLLNDLKIRKKQSIIEFIENKKEQIVLMNTIVKLKDDLDLGITLKNLRVRKPDNDSLNQAYQKIGIKR